MPRYFKPLLIAVVLYGNWLGMMAVHELGHVLHGWISGASVSRVSIPLIGFSRTDFSHNPHALFVAWGGAIWGCVIPIAIMLIVRRLRRRVVPVVVFFAGFCLIANGAYLAIGSFIAAGDAGDLMKLGCPRWVLIVFGVVTIPLGFWLWHRMGPRMGMDLKRDESA